MALITESDEAGCAPRWGSLEDWKKRLAKLPPERQEKVKQTIRKIPRLRSGARRGRR